MTNIPEILKAFEEKFGGFIATKEKRVKQDEDNAWLRLKLEALLNEAVEEVLKARPTHFETPEERGIPVGLEMAASIIESKK